VHPRHGQDPALFAAGFKVLAVLPNTGQVESPAAELVGPGEEH